MPELFCLLAAGKSERSQSRFHKTLLPAGKKAILSHILETVPEAWEIVVVLGHQAEIVRDYCLLAHPERRFTFVVDPNYGEGPGASLLCARELLQRPFVLGCCDSIITLPYHDVKGNWLAFSPTATPEKYATASLEGGRIVCLQDKCENGDVWAWTGLCRIEDYDDFWRLLKLRHDWGDDTLVTTFMGSFRRRFTPLAVEWYDVGTPDGYQQFRGTCGADWVLEKDLDELTYKVGDRGIKLYTDAEKCRRKVLRARVLGSVLPKIVSTRAHGLAYQWAAGESFYTQHTVERWRALWDGLQETLWSRMVEMNTETLQLCSNSFYRIKTLERLERLNNQIGGRLRYSPIVNSRSCRPLYALYAAVDWKWLAQGTPSPFHGDLHPDNILAAEEGKFTLIDWRDSFGGAVEGGDLYYDLAKMYSGLLVDYHRALTEDPVVEIAGDQVAFTPFRAPYLDQIRFAYEEWLQEHGYHLYRVQLLAALIHLNIAPLHTPALRDLLLFQGWSSLDALLPVSS